LLWGGAAFAQDDDPRDGGAFDDRQEVIDGDTADTSGDPDSDGGDASPDGVSSDVVSCEGVLCGVPSLCQPECCGSCPPDPCLSVVCEDALKCDPICCDACPACQGMDCDDPFSCQSYCCGSCPVECFEGVICQPSSPCVGVSCSFDSGCEEYLIDGVLCNDGDPTTGAGHCFGGQCQPGDPLPPVACVPGQPCDDGDPCTAPDTCDALGVCLGVVTDCDDGVACTDDFCSPGNGQCQNVARPERCPAPANVCKEPACSTARGCFEVDRPDGAPCDDGIGCTVDDVCRAAACQSGAALVCDDRDACTTDACVEPAGVCGAVPLGSCAVCEPAGPPVTIELSLAEELDFTQKCPLLPGDVGVKLEASLKAAGKITGCPECKTETTVEGKLSGELNLCDVTFGLEGGGSYTAMSQRCTTCGGPTCSKRCGDTACESQGYTGFAGLSISKFYGWKGGFRYTPPAVLPTLSIAASCGVKVTGKVKAEGTFETVEDKGCEPCVGCESASGKVTLGIEGEGGCGLRLRAGRYKADFGCTECGKLGLEGSVGLKDRDGECGDETCLTASATLTAGVSFPCFDAGWWWFKVNVQCSAEVVGEISYECQANDPTVSLKASCRVARGGCE